MKKIQKATGTGFPETDFSRLLNQEGKPAPQPPNVIKPAARNSVEEKFEDLPGLVAPPARPGVGLSETDFSRLLNQEGSSALLPPRVAERTVQNSTAEKSVNLPDLIAPRPRLGVRISQVCLYFLLFHILWTNIVDVCQVHCSGHVKFHISACLASPYRKTRNQFQFLKL